MNVIGANDEWREWRSPSRIRLRPAMARQAGRCPALQLAGQRPALPVVGARRDENLAKLKPIKVNQRVLRVLIEHYVENWAFYKVFVSSGKIW